MLKSNLMSKNIDNITNLLSDFGLSEEEVELYLAILRGVGDTALIISRELKYKRTTVYRILDSLIDKKLVVTRLGERGSRFIATPPDQLDFLITDREHELQDLKSSLPKLKEQLSELTHNSGDDSKVLYYHGKDGIKQITYNSLKAKGELLTYELDNMDSFMSHNEAEKLRRRFANNRINIRTLTNVAKMDAWTNVTDLVQNFWEIRHLSPNGSPFQFEILIYNNVFCMYNYTGGKAFAVEIHNQELADMQRQLFEYLWLGARKFKILDKHGTAKLA